MEPNQQRLQQQLQHHHQHEALIREEAHTCPNCGANVPQGMRFCEECGCPVEGNTCSHCHQSFDPGIALCPHCGTPTNARRCSFCGSELEDNEDFCSVCGNPRHGIICPECGTKNYRSFCRKCNYPLNEMAQQSLVKAKNNPHVIKAKKLAIELEQRQQVIQELAAQMGLFDDQGNGPQPDSKLTEISEEDLLIIRMYDELISPNAPSAIEHKPQSLPPNTKKPVEQIKTQLKQALQDYEAKVEEMKRAIDAMIPDPSDPPEIQRNFLCACQVETYSQTQTKRSECVGWICNWCGCRHHNPADCCRPELGGKWIYEEVDSISKIKTTTTIFL